MTDEYRHPMRDAEIVVYQKIEGNAGKAFIARLIHGKAYPVFFHASTHEEARRKADEFRNEAVEKNEASYAKRKAALAKAQASRKKKEAAK